MNRYVSNARSLLNNGPIFQCTIWNLDDGLSEKSMMLVDTGGTFSTIDTQIARFLNLKKVGVQEVLSHGTYSCNLRYR